MSNKAKKKTTVTDKAPLEVQQKSLCRVPR